MRTSQRFPVLSLFGLVAALACGGKSAPTVAARPVAAPAAANGALLLSDGWDARVVLDRSDSIVLTMPGGSTQLQRMSRHASFTLLVGNRQSITMRLDSIEIRPVPGRSSLPMVGTVWTGKLYGDRVEWAVTAGSGPVIEDLGNDIASFFPKLPPTGVAQGQRWSDTSTTRGRLDIFDATQRITRRWSVAADTSIGGATLRPVRSVGELEQSGKGTEGGLEMSMTGQGRRSTTYYLSKTGQMNRVVRSDSMDVMISVPASHQIVPTTRYIRTQVTFLPLKRGSGE